MRTKDREFLNAEGGRRLESMLDRFVQVKEVVPWLRPGLSYSGAIRVVDPWVSPTLLADVIEKSIAQELLVKAVSIEMIEYSQMSEELERKAEAERLRRMVSGFHRLKKSPEASDPESPKARRVRRIPEPGGTSWDGRASGGVELLPHAR
jgi:hypothetical protein